MPSLRRALRNARLLVGAIDQHLRDDPALLPIQVSRRLPMAVRGRAGRALCAVGSRLPGGVGLAALGAVMAGESARAESLLERGRRSRLVGEVAVLLERTDLVPDHAPASTRARAAWSRGDLGGAIRLLDAAGRGTSAQAAHLRSERRLLTPGVRLQTPANTSAQSSPRLAAGERLRVLHLITNSLPHTQSGYALRTHNILTALRGQGIESQALTRTGYPVMVGKAFAAREDVVDGIRYRRTLPVRLGSTPHERLEQEVQEALRLVAQFRPHVLHATTDYRNALVAQAVNAVTGIPWVYEVRGLMEQTWIASRGTPQARSEAAMSERARAIADREGKMAQAAAEVVTLGAAMAAALAERGVPAESITLVPNGVDESLFAESLDAAAARRTVGLELPAEAFVVGGVSSLVPYEGHDVLLRAAALLLGTAAAPGSLRDSLHVVIVGDGTSAPTLAALARELGIEDRVHLRGRVSRQAARQWVQVMDVVAVPRLDLDVTRSVTPQKPAEALALRRPVIVSDLPALRETVTDTSGAVHAALVDAGDPESLARAIAELADDPERRSRLADGGREMARARTWPVLMRRYAAMYEHALHQGPVNASSKGAAGGH